MATGVDRYNPRQLLDVGTHLDRTQRTVDADRNQLGMSNRVPEGLECLARKRAAGIVGDGHRHRHRQTHAVTIKVLLDRKQARLQIQRVKSRFRHQQVDTPFDQTGDLLEIGDDQFVKMDRAETRIVHVRRHRRGAIGRTQAASDKTTTVWCAVAGTIGGTPSQAGGRQVDVEDTVLESVVGQ